MAAYFDENVFLAVVGGGFLRTPFLHSTQALPDGVNEENDCSSLDGEVIHIPAALRVNGLNMDNPPFRRVVFSADLIKRISTSEAVAYNQKEAGLTFGFNDAPHHSVARVVVDEYTHFQGQPALFVDNIEPGFQPQLPTFMNNPEDRSRPTGFLVFVSRSWREERHIDPNILMQHQIPLQFDQEFDGVPLIPEGSQFHLTLPVYGAKGTLKAWDMRMGPDRPGEIFDESGTIEVKYDVHGSPYLEIEGTGTPNDLLPIAMEDSSGQFFSRNLVLEDQLPDQSTLYLPTMRIGTPVKILVTLPDDYTLDMANSRLPRGLEYKDGFIEGVPEEYGPYWRIVGVPALECGDGETCPQDAVVVFAVNRPPCTLMVIGDGSKGSHGTTLGNDRNTGEYYAVQFLPYGLAMTYGGWAYMGHRRFSSGFRYPIMKKIPWVYGRANRRSAVEQEVLWRTRCSYPREVTYDDPALYYRMREYSIDEPPKNFGWIKVGATWRALDKNDVELEGDGIPQFRQPSLILNREDEGDEAIRFRWFQQCQLPENDTGFIDQTSRLNLESDGNINGATTMTRTYEFWATFEGDGTIWHQGDELFGARIYKVGSRLIIGHWNFNLDVGLGEEPVDETVWFWVDGIENDVPYYIAIQYDQTAGAKVFIDGEERIALPAGIDWPAAWSSFHLPATIGGKIDNSIECGDCSPQSSPFISPTGSPCPDLCRSPLIEVPGVLIPESGGCAHAHVMIATGPVYYYRMEEDNPLSTLLVDSSGNGNNGQIVAAIREVAGLVENCPDDNKSFGFTGTHALVPANNSQTQLATFTQRSVSFMFRPEGVGALTGRQVLWETGGGTRGFNAYLDGDTLYVGSWDVGLVPQRLNWTSVGGIQVDTTYQVTWRWDGSTGTMELFLNGVLVDTLVDPTHTSILSHSGSGGIGFANDSTVYHDGTNPGTDADYYIGRIDELAIWNLPLGNEVVTGIYESAFGLIETVQSPVNDGTGVAFTREIVDPEITENPSFGSLVVPKVTESINGVIDEFALYTKLLDDREITRHYEIGIFRF